MRRTLLLVVILLLACQAAGSLVAQEPTEAPAPVAVAESPEPSPSPFPSATPSLTPQVVPTLAVSPTPETAYTVQFHPDGDLIVGDLVSLEVIPPLSVDLEDQQVKVQVDPPNGPTFGPVEFSQFGIGGRLQVTLQWVWDTHSEAPGVHTLEISVLPDGPVWSTAVILSSQEDFSFPEPAGKWASAKIDCCVVHYITGTAAERDLGDLLAAAEEQAVSSRDQLGANFKQPIPVVFLPRLLGHGGFAGNEIYISYLDRNSVGNHPDLVLHHEMVHLLDGRLGGDLRPSILVEGLAVYLTGGHFKREPLLTRAASLLELGWYIPLQQLTDDFYFSQHEIGYLQAGALVEYMVNTWGFDAFSEFYRRIHPHPSGSQAQAIDVALEEHFGLNYAQLEERFLAALARYPLNPDLLADVDLTVRFFDTLRRYQQILDPSAYFLSAWLPGFEEMRERDLVADYLRSPQEVENIALEALLLTTHERLRAGKLSESTRTLNVLTTVLNAWEANDPKPFSSHPLAEDYLAIVNLLLKENLVAQDILLLPDRAIVLASAGEAGLITLELLRGEDDWVILQRAG
jgi:hypothetical protein